MWPFGSDGCGNHHFEDTELKATDMEIVTLALVDTFGEAETVEETRDVARITSAVVYECVHDGCDETDHRFESEAYVDAQTIKETVLDEQRYNNERDVFGDEIPSGVEMYYTVRRVD